MVAELDVIAPICNSQFGICQRTGTDRLTDDMLTPDYIHWLNTAFTQAARGHRLPGDRYLADI